MAQKYFRGQLGSEERESSLKQIIDRVADRITDWGEEGGYLGSADERETFRDELKHLLVTQKASFNSPVWFNIGVEGVPQQASACFILSVEDTMPSILNWYVEEGLIFKGGSGSGINLSRLRSSAESSAWRRHRQRSGELHARRRRLRRHDQERRHDATRRQDGHLWTAITPTSKSSSGAKR